MTTARCTRKHTPIVSKSQKRLFGYWKGHPGERPESITEAEVSSHLREAKGKKLPSRKRKRT